MKKIDTNIDIFIAYSRKDKEILEALKTNLHVLIREKICNEIWYDGLIQPGELWDNKIKEKLFKAKIILLLISSDFLASDNCYDSEMQKALQLHKEGKTRVIPIIARECYWEESPFKELQVLPKDGLPIIGDAWPSKDRPYYIITKAIAKLIKGIVDLNTHNLDEEKKDYISQFVGKEVWNYKIEKYISSGGFGSVYLGKHKYLHRKYTDNLIA